MGEDKIIGFCAGVRASSICDMYLYGLMWHMECKTSKQPFFTPSPPAESSPAHSRCSRFSLLVMILFISSNESSDLTYIPESFQKNDTVDLIQGPDHGTSSLAGFAGNTKEYLSFLSSHPDLA